MPPKYVERERQKYQGHTHSKTGHMPKTRHRSTRPVLSRASWSPQTCLQTCMQVHWHTVFQAEAASGSPALQPSSVLMLKRRKPVFRLKTTHEGSSLQGR